MLLLIAFVLLPLQPQQPRDVASAQSPRTSAIYGRVLDHMRVPVGRAVVQVVGVLPGGGRTAMTGDDGTFVIEELPAGRFTVVAAKPGFPRAEFGQRTPYTPGTTVVLLPGARFQADILLPRGAVVTGTLLDERGEPAMDRPVGAARWISDGSTRHLRIVRTATADARGAFRLWGLAAGEYVVTSGLSVSESVQAPEGSVTVVLEAGQERAVHLQLTSGQTPVKAPLRGVALGADGRAIKGTRIQLMNSVTREVVRDPVVEENGFFQFRQVREGRYRLVAQATVYGAAVPPNRLGVATTYWGQTDVQVNGSDPVTTAVTMVPGSSIAGRVVGRGATALNVSQVYVNLVPVDLSPSILPAVGPRRIDPDGSFRIEGIPPGSYMARINASPALAGWHIASVMAGDTDVLDFAIRIPADPMPELLVTLDDRATALAGNVVDSKGAAAPGCSVIAYSSDPRHWPAGRRLALARPDSTGAYAVNSLPPGSYRVAITADVPAAWKAPAYLNALVPAATDMLRPGEPLSRDLVGR